ncbi:hypothetical protein EV178_002493 [Coemansia sp. RSA 1646]|nr:hypothetical protein EV178_002493 [Coemansia sp. RSA 1646]
MGHTPARGIARTLSSSSDYDNTERRSRRKQSKQRTNEGHRAAIEAASHHLLQSTADNETRSSDAEMGGQEIVVDTADEGDEEFVQTSSGSDLEEEEEERQLEFSSESNSPAPRHTRRRTSMRLSSSRDNEPDTPSRYPLHQRLRQSLRLRDQHEPSNSSGENGSPKITPERTTRRRRVTHGLRDIGSLFDGAAVDQKGYASSPTTSVSRRLRKGRADNVHRHSSLRNQMPPDSPDLNANNSDDYLSMKIDTPSRSAVRLAHRAEAGSSGRKRVAPSLIASISGGGLVPAGEALSSPAPPRSQSRKQLFLPQETPISPPPIIDKPREERSYKEFFPDFNVFTPMEIRFHGTTVDSPSSTTLSPGTQQTQQQLPLTASSAEDTINQSLSAASSAPLTSLSSIPPLSAASETPLQDLSSASNGDTKAANNNESNGLGDRLPQPSRSSSGLSIKLVFNDPEAAAINNRHHTASLPAYLGIDPFQGPSSLVLRSPGPGKSTASYAGTPQSSVVVLAPKNPVLSLKETRFRQIEGNAANLGYRPAEFKRPEGHYIRNIELTEKDLAERIEYDLEDADRLWLQRLNESRAAQGSVEISANMLERIIDHMEKEWFELVKEAQRAISAIHQKQLPTDESACAICNEEECDNANVIVYCDGCNLAVHQDCYGVPYIPEGQWLCRSCMLSPDKEVACILCPQRGGAFKKTTTNKWVHLLCALWIPEVGISNTTYMEPIDSVDQIPRSRWKLCCHLCRRKVGACIQCSHRQCCTAFHVTCARKAHFSMVEKLDRRTGEPVRRPFCERHSLPTHTQKIDLSAPLKFLGNTRRKNPPVGGSSSTPTAAAALSLLSSDLVSILHGAGDGASSGQAANGSGGQWWPATSVDLLAHPTEEVAALFDQATAATMEAAAGGDPLGSGKYKASEDASLQLTMRIFNPGRPVLNEYVFAKVVETAVPANRIGANQRIHLVSQIARYWALKRFTRYGVPLLKRLHLEPWTASVTQQREIEMAEEQRQMALRRIRTDLERVRLLVESVRRREREKLKSARLLVEYLRKVFDPLNPVLLDMVDELIERRDPRGVLSYPVTLDDAPDYFDVIKEPMDFRTIRQNIREHKYRSVDEVERHLNLVIANCMIYNKPTTYYYQLATRIKRHVERLVAEAKERISAMPIDPESGRLLVDVDMGIFELDGRIPSSVNSEAKNASGDGTEVAEKTPETGLTPAKPAAPSSTPATAPMTRSSRHNQPSAGVVTDADADIDASKQAKGKGTPKDSKAAKGPTEAVSESAKTRSAEGKKTGTAAEKLKRSKNDKTSTTPKKKPVPANREPPASEPRKPRLRAPEGQKKAVANRRKTQGPSSSSSSSRQLTLFEQMSIPPPDVRQQLRGRYAFLHPNTPLPDDDIPDDVNVIKSRLRRTSMATVPLTTIPVTPTKRSSAAARSEKNTPQKKLKKVATPDTSASQRRYSNGIALPTAAFLGEDSSQYAIGTPVWAKMTSFPWFPAAICDPQMPDIPEGVHEDKQSDDCNTLVWFYSSNPTNPVGSRSWKWVTSAQVCKLGVNKALDEMFFKAQKVKSWSMVKGVRNAYIEACRETKTQQLAFLPEKR